MIHTRHSCINKSPKQLSGFSLVELMVAMFVGFIIITGIFSLHTVTRKTQVSSEVQMDMVADARFAIEMIGYDLRHAGIWGGNNRAGLIQCAVGGPPSCDPADVIPPAPINDCGTDWAYNFPVPVSGVDDSEATNPYSGTCIPPSEKFLVGTDILEVKYADSNYIDVTTNMPKPLVDGQAYVRSSVKSGKIFVGTTQPVIQSGDTGAQNYPLRAYAYYISEFTDAAGDGVPSLRRVALTNGPAMTTQTLLSGVADMQIQYGEDINRVEDANGNFAIERYVNANAITNPANILSVKIWLLMRSDQKHVGVNTAKSFSLAGKPPVTYGGQDDYRYFMVTSFINLRNANL